MPENIVYNDNISNEQRVTLLLLLEYIIFYSFVILEMTKKATIANIGILAHECILLTTGKLHFFFFTLYIHCYCEHFVEIILPLILV